jgi:hypothetical protein
MPKRKKMKKRDARLVKNARAPRDIGDPRKARVETLKWLKGDGPMPEQFNLLLPDDGEALDRFREDLWVHPDRVAELGKPGGQFPFEAEATRKDMVESEAARLKAEVTELEPKAKVGAKVIGGGRARGLANAEAQAALCLKWERDLSAYYKDYPPTRHSSYRTEAGRLLLDVRVKWTADTPGYDLLRKKILPPLLREKFPHLYS